MLFSFVETLSFSPILSSARNGRKCDKTNNTPLLYAVYPVVYPVVRGRLYVVDCTWYRLIIPIILLSERRSLFAVFLGPLIVSSGRQKRETRKTRSSYTLYNS